MDGVLTCTVLRQLTPAGAGPEVYNLTRPFYVMLARGPASGEARFKPCIPVEDFRSPQPITFRLELKLVQLWF